MFIERKVNPTTHAIELWECRWENHDGQPAKKVFVKFLGEEQPLPQGSDAWSQTKAICWAPDRTLGNIAVFSENVLGSFPEKQGDNAILPCDIVGSGKFRNGAPRWWCRTHQTHWGKKADLAAFDISGQLQCSSHPQPMNYVVSPLEINCNDYAEVGIWCSLPRAISSSPVKASRPRIHVHLRDKENGEKIVDKDYPAISLVYFENLGLFKNEEITRVNITPPAAIDFVLAIEEGRELHCINCKYCGFPHLDLGDFARTPHKKHFCGNCGSDSVWSKDPIVSTPLKLLHDELAKSTEFVVPDRSINIDDYEGCTYAVWASTPAVLWTANREQEKGIHVHIDVKGGRVVDETFGEVILNGRKLNRNELLRTMLERAIAI
jgi:hypothetical protein